MIKLFYVVSIFIYLLIFGPQVDIFQKTFAQTVSPFVNENKSLQSSSASQDTKIAPGELLPVAVKLSNFGGGKRVDVTISYIILSEKGKEIFKSSETVAVETTNNFVKNIKIPSNTNPGVYTVKTSIVYKGQTTPAITEFTFLIERRIFGLFQSELIIYLSIMLTLGVLSSIIVYSIARHSNFSRYSPMDYSKIPHNERVYYELISDTILDMHHRVGDQAIVIASAIKGLSIDNDTGRVIQLTEDPAKIIAQLVTDYEKNLGKNVSFSFRKA